MTESSSLSLSIHCASPLSLHPKLNISKPGQKIQIHSFNAWPSSSGPPSETRQREGRKKDGPTGGQSAVRYPPTTGAAAEFRYKKKICKIGYSFALEPHSEHLHPSQLWLSILCFIAVAPNGSSPFRGVAHLPLPSHGRIHHQIQFQCSRSQERRRRKICRPPPSNAHI